MTINFARTAAEFRAKAAKVRRQLERTEGFGFVKSREVEFIPLDANGDRIGDPDYCKLAELSGRTLHLNCELIIQRYPACATIGVEVGFDGYESRASLLDPYADYEPRIGHCDIDVSASALRVAFLAGARLELIV